MQSVITVADHGAAHCLLDIDALSMTRLNDEFLVICKPSESQMQSCILCNRSHERSLQPKSSYLSGSSSESAFHQKSFAVNDLTLSAPSRIKYLFIFLTRMMLKPRSRVEERCTDGPFPDVPRTAFDLSPGFHATQPPQIFRVALLQRFLSDER